MRLEDYDIAPQFRSCPDCHTTTGEHDAGCPTALADEIRDYEAWRSKRLTVRGVQRFMKRELPDAVHVPVGTGRIRSREEH